MKNYVESAHGSTKREKSQVLITKAPDILDSIASDSNASPRHRVDAIKTLDGMAANGPAGVPAADCFSIVINLGDQVLSFDKPIKPDANPKHIDAAPQTEWLPVIETSEKKDGGGGQGHI